MIGLGYPTYFGQVRIFAIMGSAAFVGGICRMVLSMTMIMLEATGDLFFLLLDEKHRHFLSFSRKPREKDAYSMSSSQTVATTVMSYAFVDVGKAVPLPATLAGLASEDTSREWGGWKKCTQAAQRNGLRIIHIYGRGTWSLTQFGYNAENELLQVPSHLPLLPWPGIFLASSSL